MKQALAILLMVMLVGCSPEARHDRENLDSRLSTIQIDRVEFVSSKFGNNQITLITNIVSGVDAQKLLTSLAATNRVLGKELKDETSQVYFMKGTQKVLELELAENGLWTYGAYKFSLHSPWH
jgi:hypothetical protein